MIFCIAPTLKREHKKSKMVIRIFTLFANSCQASDWDSPCLPRPKREQEKSIRSLQGLGQTN